MYHQTVHRGAGAIAWENGNREGSYMTGDRRRRQAGIPGNGTNTGPAPPEAIGPGRERVKYGASRPANVPTLIPNPNDM